MAEGYSLMLGGDVEAIERLRPIFETLVPAPDKGWVADSGEDRWTAAEAIDLDVPAPVITLSLQQRLISRQSESYAAKLLAAMRNEFGGHTMKTE
jgi:6-phosphogluconate dehydrogenase (decarboxylating)